MPPATASVLLTPMLRERAEMLATRQSIEAIIASGSYRPVFQALGVAHGQGFLFARPAAVEAINGSIRSAPDSAGAARERR